MSHNKKQKSWHSQLKQMNFMNFFISLKYLPRINDAGCYEMVRYFKQYYLGGGGELLVINYKISVKYVE